jgi:predicted transcriptional regulator
MIIRRLSKSDVEKEPYLVWNSFIDLIAMEDYDDLDEVQRIAHLCFWYDSEVQNGGHLQYFENRRLDLLPVTLEALNRIGAISQSDILKSAIDKLMIKPRKKIETVEEFVELAREGEFEKLDNNYYDASPSVLELLDKYLEQNQEYFVTIV